MRNRAKRVHKLILINHKFYYLCRPERQCFIAQKPLVTCKNCKRIMKKAWSVSGSPVGGLE